MTKQETTAQEFISAIDQVWDHSECWTTTAAAGALSEEDERRIRSMMTEDEDYGTIEEEVMAHVRKRVAVIVGTRIGKAIARDVLADDLPREWTGLDPQDGDQLLAAGIDNTMPEWTEAEEAAQVEYERIVDEATLVCGSQVSVDRSGVGHCWTAIDARDIPGQIRDEIEGEMIDGGQDTCERFRASNGLFYRW